ncbi:hypothetical protein OZ411_06630 [Bradyrhizobium sp. Arg237L]|uniref:nucleotide-binding protein n=1 Tax=Bradyrhizobium sp. Arg237L TaxID=3003352 RepID=UPI00249E32D4|nr:hypothetical protein [Bradyrhizobium sp. Arg237L]MDI4232488.1 hypothetical protein [Bradyrhizobium sp. Arg237L]
MKSAFLSSTSATAIIVTADDGGVGKTTVAVQIASFLRLHGIEPLLFQLDSKEKLAAKTGLPVHALSVSSVASDRGDGLRVTDVIAPWYRAVTTTNESGRRYVLLEVGAANAALFHTAVTQFDLQEDIELLGLDVHVFVVTKAGEDSAIQTVREIKRLETNLPGASIVIVKNEVLGRPETAAEYLDDRLKKAYLGVLKKYPNIRMEKIDARSMALYERLHVTPDVIVGWYENDYREAIARTGMKRDEAKLFVKDIAVWTAKMIEQITAVFPKLNENSDG